MNADIAMELIEETSADTGEEYYKKLSELVMWAYEQGWSEGIADYREEQDPTEYQEWRATR